MNRRDYRKLMNIKKRNKNYAKATILGALGLGFFGITTQVNAEEWKANTVEQIKESVKEAKDGIYIIKTGDTLSGISEATGITIETLAKVNNIRNVDLIYAGDKLIIKTEDGKVALVDSDNNVKNEVPLTNQDKQGIKEVQKQDNNNVYTNNGSSTNTSKGNNSGSSSNGNNVINTVKPVKPSEGNDGVNTGGTTNPVNPTKPVDPIKPNPVEPVDPTPVDPKVETVDVEVSYIDVDTMDIVSEGTVKVELDKDGKGELVAITPKGFELVGETKVEITKDVKTVIFDVKKVDEVKEITVQAVFQEVDADGKVIKVLGTEPITTTEGANVEAKAKEFDGYTLQGSDTQVLENATDGATITFNYRKVDVPTPIESFKVITQYVDENGEVLADPKVSDKVEKGTLYKAEAIDINGYTVKGESTQTVLVNSDTTIKFVYTKDETPTTPTNEDRFVVVNIDVNGKDLGQNVNLSKYELVSSKKDNGIIETLENGNTITTYTTTNIYKLKEDEKPYEPKHTEETVIVNVDEEGYILKDTTGYTKVSESTDSGATYTSENGDTHTVYTKTVIWKQTGHVPQHKNVYRTINVDTDGNPIDNTNLYDYVSESTDDGITTTFENGDTETVYTTTKVWQKKSNPNLDYGARPTSADEIIIGEWNGIFYHELGNSGMTFANTADANNWAFENHPGSASNSWGTAEVRMKGTNEIRITVEFF